MAEFPDALIEQAAHALIRHSRIPKFDGHDGQRCAGCDHLDGETDGPNSPRHLAHAARAVLEAVAPAIRAAGERKALRDLANSIDPTGYGWTDVKSAERFKARLHERADQINPKEGT